MRKLLLLLVLVAQPFSVALADFTDVPPTPPQLQYNTIRYLYQHNMVDGYPDGSFKPRNEINRAELLKMLVKAARVEVGTGDESCFQDVPAGLWYTPYVCKAKQLGWVSGYPDGTFKPDRTVNKFETLKMISNAFNWPETYCKPFEEAIGGIFYPKGIDVKAWYFPYFKKAWCLSFIEFDYTGSLTFKGGENYSRGEVSEILFRTAAAQKMDLYDSRGLSDIIPAVYLMDFVKIDDAVKELDYQKMNKADVFKGAAKGSNGHDYIVAEIIVPDLRVDHGWGKSYNIAVFGEFDKEHKLVALGWQNHWKPIGEDAVRGYYIEPDKNFDKAITVKEWWLKGQEKTDYETNTYKLDELR